VFISGIGALFNLAGSKNELPVVDTQDMISVINPDTSSNSQTQTSISNPSENQTQKTTLTTEKKTTDANISKPAGKEAVITRGEETRESQTVIAVVNPDAEIVQQNASLGQASEKTTGNIDEVNPSPVIQDKADNPENAILQAPGNDSLMAAKPVSTDNSDISTSVKPPIETKGKDPAKNLSLPAYAAGVYYLPEYMFNTVEGGKFVNNFGIDFTYYRGRTSIRTGAGISVSKGVTEKSVEYNEFLGTYNKLDSITFVYNESAHNFYPNIFTSSENVWDSLSLYDSSEIVKRYTYLQVPLILGFDFWQKNRVTLGVRVGTVMSVMLASKQLTGNYDPGANQVLGISNLSPNQVSTNWQAIAGISGSFLLTRRLYLEIEPEVKYYYQSIYERTGNEKKPWSVGLRMAILYKF
jgi:hypothetical protein